MPKASRTFRIPTLLGLLLVLPVLGCPGARGEVDRPEATLAGTRDAQLAFRDLRAAWFLGSTSERRKLEPRLRAFILRFPRDPQADMARVLLAFNAVSRGALAEARALIAPLQSRPGSLRDFTRVVNAEALLREQKADAAWALLEPLAGKVVDPDERIVLGQVRLRAASAARRYERALRAAEELLSEAPAEAQTGVEQMVRELFLPAPKAELLASLGRLEQTELDRSAATQARDWLRKMLRERLVAIAVQEKDAALARRLLDTAPAALRASATGSALVSIAGGAQSMPLILGRSIGVALSLGTAEVRRRSASLAAGLTRGLGLPDAAKQAGAVHLISGDDGGSSAGTAEALRELAAEGAAILVAGVDGPSANAAARFAEENAIAVILIQPPDSVPAAARNVFVLGESWSAEQAAIDAELSRRGVLRAARVGHGGEACDAPPPNPGSTRFPVQDWRRDRLDALIVLGSAACASDVATELRAQAFSPQLVLGLEAADFVYASDAPPGCLALSAGAFPSALRPDAGGNPALPALDWFEALGHDAALLAKQALRGFPDGRVDDARAVRELHGRAERALETAQVELWTSESPGFSQGHVLRRTLTMVSPHLPAKKTP